MGQLANRIESGTRTRDDGSVAKGKEDMVGISPWIDVRGTKQLLNAKTSTKADGIGTYHDDDNGRVNIRLTGRGKSHLRQIIAQVGTHRHH